MRRPASADRGHGHDDQQVQQQHRRELDGVALRGEHPGERHRREDREHPPEQPAARREGRPACGEGRAAPPARVPGVLMTWTSIGPDPRSTRLTTDPLTSSASRDRRDAPRTSCVAPSERAASSSASATSPAGDLEVAAAELGQQRPVRVEELLRGHPAPRRRPARAPRRGRTGRGWPCGRPAAPGGRRPARRSTRPRPAHGSPTVARSRGAVRYSVSASSTRSATHSSASSRSADRLPSRK